MKRLSFHIFLPLGLVCLVLLSSCSTKKNTAVNRGFHNISARFNGLFNAREIMKESVKKMEDEYLDDYYRVLPLFTYGSPKDAKTATPQMEKVFKKCSQVIERHSMLIKGVEHVKWIDETYLEIGKSHFYKHDYFAGIEAFEYVVSEFKKEPTKFQALMWIIRTYNEIGAFTKAQGYIDLIDADKTFPYQYIGEFSAIKADFYSKQEQYTLAVKELNKAISYEKNREHKARYLFIMAQMLQILDQKDRARTTYSRVVKLNPKYELTFYAKINQAKLYEATAAGSGEIKNELTRMLKDIKNLDYNDQIYYALAEIAEKERNEQLAIDLLKKSMKATTTNTSQKGLSALKLADIYFARPEYKPAGMYYDSAVASISKDYPGYEQIVNKKNNLARLIMNYEIIEMEDSLQNLAGMGEDALRKLIKKKIEDLKEEDARKKEEEELAAQQAQNANLPRQTTPTPGSGGAWYFYNQQTMSFGFTDFTKRWGNRKLEDHWRRSNKQSFAVVENADSVQAVAAGSGKDPRYTEAFYIKDIPLTKARIDSSNAKIVEAYYDLSLIYKEQLSNPSKAAESLEALLGRLPKNKYELASYYQLYRLYTQLNLSDKASKYRDILLNKYPTSDYALILKDPDYNLKLKASKSKADLLYEGAYNLFLANAYDQSLSRCLESDSLQLVKPLKGQFALLKALNYGGLRRMDDYEKALRQVVVNYTGQEVKAKAQEYLDAYMKVKDGPISEPADTTKAPGPAVFEFLPTAEHFFVLAMLDNTVNSQSISTRVSDFNLQYFESSGITVNPVPLGKDKTLIVVKSFSGKIKAYEYFETFRDQCDILTDYPNAFPYFIITKQNFNVLLKQRDVVPYMQFFTQNYSGSNQANK